jgi:hypothetical protein
MTGPAPTAPETSTTTCPTCHSPATGKYCSNCGAPLAGAQCAACQTALTPGAKFCHRCGTPATASASDVRVAPAVDRGLGSALPWAVAAIALVALIALAAAQRIGRSGPSTAIASTDAPAAIQGGPTPVDISQMSPEERAQRLYDRVMSLNARERTDSVQFFAPMAMQAYVMLGSLDAGQRYDLGRIAAVSGATEIAKAQADTILASQPQHLLGLMLAADIAAKNGDRTAETAYLRRFAAAAASERATQLPENQQHIAEIDSRLARASAR